MASLPELRERDVDRARVALVERVLEEVRVEVDAVRVEGVADPEDFGLIGRREADRGDGGFEDFAVGVVDER